MVTKEFQIEGMSCGHCVMAVKKELEKVDKIKIEDVQIGSAKITFDDSELDQQIIIDAVEEAGYKIK